MDTEIPPETFFHRLSATWIVPRPQWGSQIDWGMEISKARQSLTYEHIVTHQRTPIPDSAELTAAFPVNNAYYVDYLKGIPYVLSFKFPMDPDEILIAKEAYIHRAEIASKRSRSAGAVQARKDREFDDLLKKLKKAVGDDPQKVSDLIAFVSESTAS